jgi:hypothetical protein
MFWIATGITLTLGFSACGAPLATPSIQWLNSRTPFRFQTPTNAHPRVTEAEAVRIARSLDPFTRARFDPYHQGHISPVLAVMEPTAGYDRPMLVWVVRVGVVCPISIPAGRQLTVCAESYDVIIHAGRGTYVAAVSAFAPLGPKR